MILPTFEEFFSKSHNTISFDVEDYDKEVYACPNCGKGVKRDYSMVFMSNPPKYKYFCKECGYKYIG